MDTFDVAVIGAGPAGLTAAIYLARFRRRVLLLDGGAPRANWIPESHNTPGFPEGVGGPELLARLRDQAARYGVRPRPGRVTGLARLGDGEAAGFALELAAGRATAAKVLLATGVVDTLPDIPGLFAAVEAGQVRICPICDAYEVIDKRIAVLTDGAQGEREADFLRTYTQDVTVLQAAAAANLRFAPDGARLSPPGGAELRFDCLYLALGCTIQNALAVACGAAHDADGSLVVDGHQQTSVPGLYAAGDLVRGLNQIAVATGEAAIAATAIHNALREQAASLSNSTACAGAAPNPGLADHDHPRHAQAHRP